ncbi:MAG: sigma-54-dependent Fis family transcriptional regulator [Gammaproteobacteria bacterium]|nr:sigma-54-dependent Fis family transcriptional regulator [Gammaproteobacteria bacterium]
MSTAHILVVDDEPDIRSLVREILEDEGFEVSVAENAEQARQSRRTRRPDLVLLDIWMPDTDGISLLKEWSLGNNLDIPVIMISGHGTVETAVEATRLGAYDFIEKPLSLAKLLLTVQRALETASLKRENIGLRKRVHTAGTTIGHSTALATLRDQIDRIAGLKTPVLITGESGSGKEVMARYLHNHSSRRDGPFVNVNVAGLARENPDIELFGSEDGGNVYFGSIEQAYGGTLFLKDIADLDPSVQARLLSALENQAFLRVNGREPVAADVRIVAASRHDLQEAIRHGRFRDDLYYHLNVVPLRVPSLCEHADDVPELLEHYVEFFASQEGLPRRQFSPSAQKRLRAYEWPGNVRELKNLVQRLLILGSGDGIEVTEVNAALGTSAATAPDAAPGYELPLREARERFEKAYLEYQLRTEGGSVSKVASRIGMERTHLYRKLRALGIDPKLSKLTKQ